MTGLGATKPILWIVDDFEDELETHRQVLKRVLQSVEVRTFLAPRNKHDFLPLLSNQRTVCILLDQRLKDGGTATYTGIELAKYINSISPSLPVFILTKYPENWDEFAGEADKVEEILDKEDMRPLDQARIGRVKARIQRRISVYLHEYDANAKRVRTLLLKSRDGVLSSQEIAELGSLDLARNAGAFAEDLEQIAELQQLSSAHRELMAEVRRERDE